MSSQKELLKSIPTQIKKTQKTISYISQNLNSLEWEQLRYISKALHEFNSSIKYEE